MKPLNLAEQAIHDLGHECWLLSGRIPQALTWDTAQFDEVWALHPVKKHLVNMFGSPVETPRWQQAFGADYHYSGNVNQALPIPSILEPLHTWVQETIESRLNGLLLNWYDGPAHYIGPHNDDTRDIVRETPIVTVSFGETRTYRLTRKVNDQKELRDFPAPHGTVFVMPLSTNKAWKHGVPKSTKHIGRRISVTFRAFERGALSRPTLKVA